MHKKNLSQNIRTHKPISLRDKKDIIISGLKFDKQVLHQKSRSEKNSPAGLQNFNFNKNLISKKSFSRETSPDFRLIRSEKVSPRNLKLNSISKPLRIKKSSHEACNVYLKGTSSRRSPKIGLFLQKKSNSSLTDRSKSTTRSPKFAKNEKEELIKLITRHFKHDLYELTTSLKFYKIIRLIGQGAFGKVVLATQVLTGAKVAIKLIDKAYMQDDHSRRKVFREIYILKKIKSLFVINILEFFESEENVFIVTEYMEGGDLLHYLKKHGRVPSFHCKNLFYQILQGAVTIHKNGVLHRDFKLDNILLDKAYKSVKICDFGVSKLVRKGEIISDQCGTPAYLAPEIVLDKGYEGYWSDIWSLGVLLYCMICGTVPFKADNVPDLHKLILIGKYDFPEFLGQDVKDLIQNMLQMVPKNRIKLEDALNHPWFDDCDKKNDKDFQEETLKIDENALRIIEEFGYPRIYAINTIEYRSLNHVNAVYNVLKHY